MKKLICLLIAVTVLASLTACGVSAPEVKQDSSPVTMLVSLGNSEDYYLALKDLIKSELDIDVEFVYQVSADTTSMVRTYFANNDLPADIIFTASKTDDALLKDSCVDLLSRSSVTAQFTPKTVQSCTTEDGAIYQLPVSTRLIGITYNETLLNEMGWDVPNDFNDMLDLKAKCDEAGIKFAVSDGAATGHGFNWLFHLMGAQWISTPEGTEWFEGYMAGTRSIDEFKEHCEYFKKWTEAGLWGSVHAQDWNGNAEFSKTRALFWFGLVNTVTGYDGMQYDDEGNETGVELHDTYKSIPWISEDGSNNCYTYYDNCWVYVNKELEQPDKSEKFEKVLSILELLTTDKASQLVSDIAKDTYVSVKSYEMSDDRLYYSYKENVTNGFLQPWYYNEFDMNSIVFTGEAVNSYISGTGDYDSIFEILDQYNQQALNSETEILASFPDGLDFEDCAKLCAISAGIAYDNTLKENGANMTAEVSIVPYTTDWNQLMPCKSVPVMNSVVYPGDMPSASGNILVPNGATTPLGINMTGLEIKELVEKGFDPSDKFIDAETGESKYDSDNYGPFPYLYVVKGGAEIKDDEVYLVVISEAFLSKADFAAFNDAGKVVTGLENVQNILSGVNSFAAEHKVITSSDLVW